jgi:stringent starvation protein B
VAIYARENGQGMAFPVPAGSADGPGAPIGATEPGETGEAAPRGLRLATTEPPPGEQPDDTPPDAPNGGGKRPSLKRVK